jgi:hypothetical protein
MKRNEMKVRSYGVSGQDASGEYRFIDVWVKRGDRWQAVASQLTRIAKP